MVEQHLDNRPEWDYRCPWTFYPSDHIWGSELHECMCEICWNLCVRKLRYDSQFEDKVLHEELKLHYKRTERWYKITKEIKLCVYNLRNKLILWLLQQLNK